MKIKGQNTRDWLSWMLAVILMAAILLLLYLMTGHSLNKKTNEPAGRSYLCDAEIVDGEHFLGGSDKFRNAHCQSDEQAFSGKYSCKCNKQKKYGFTRNFDNLQPGDVVIFSVWVLEEEARGKLVFSSEGNDIYQSTDRVVEERSGWKKFSDTIEIPLYFKETRTVIYPFVNQGKGNVYFDDLEVKIISPSNNPEQAYPGAHLEIQLTSENMAKIEKKRDEAWELGLLFSSREDLVDADIKIGDKNYGARIRLKGDLLDHLRNGKYSFRIELKGNKEWNGMNIFSVHNSQARSHLAEWYMHELFRQEDIITPQYDFVRISLNGRDLGVYAYEQHFDNTLLEINKRPIGPIIRHTDDAYWENVNQKFEPFYWTDASQIELFNKENANDPEFVRLYDQAHSMLNDFIKGRKSVSEVFDMDRLARFFALLETSHAIHAQLITNIRFYLNPYEGLLEPIGYDCFGDKLPNVNKNWSAMGEGFNRNWDSSRFIETGNDYMALFFADDDFYRAYIRYLLHYTSNDYLAAAKKNLEDASKARAIFIRSDEEYKNYAESWDRVFLKSEFNHKKIYPKPNFSLIAYIRDNDRSLIQLHGFHYYPLEVIGFMHRDVRKDLDKPILIEAYNPGIENQYVNVDLEAPAHQVIYRTLGTDSLFFADIPRISAPLKDIGLVKVDMDALKRMPYLTITDKRISFKPGIHKISQSLILPEGYTVNISAGTSLMFENNAQLISYSPINAMGSVKEKIRFIGSNGSMSAIYIQRAQKPSKFVHCQFINLGQMQLHNIQTDGALSAYKTKIELDHCQFVDIQAKDALNLVMSQCSIYNATFERCKGDLLDSYFSNVFIKSLYANRIGKDAIELSGGLLTGNDITLNNILRSGIRVMDSARVNLADLRLKDVESGIYASDHTNIYVNRVNLTNVERGVEMISEHPPHAEMKLLGFKAVNVDQEYMIQQGAVLRINGYPKKAF